MPYADELRTLAEVAVALAGFSGIVVALEDRFSPNQPRPNRARLRELLLASLGVVFFGLMPAILGGAAVDDEWGYRASQLLLAAYQLLLISLFSRSTGFTSLSRAEWLALPFGLSVVFLQFATVLGFLARQLHVVYFLALVCLLFVATLNFVLLLLEDGAPPNEMG
jgi:hypothetical protein